MALKSIMTRPTCSEKIPPQQNKRWSNRITSIIILGLFVNKITNFGNEDGQVWLVYFSLCLLLIPFFITRIKYEIQISSFLENTKGTLDDLLGLSDDLCDKISSNNLHIVFAFNIYFTYTILYLIFSKQVEKDNHTICIIFALLCIFYMEDVKNVLKKFLKSVIYKTLNVNWKN
jgi:hypothetical protein